MATKQIVRRQAKWISEFHDFLQNCLDGSRALVIFDLRMDDFRPQLSKKILRPEMPVIVTGVMGGKIAPIDQWPKSEIPAQEFANLAEAQAVFPDLSLRSIQ